MTSFEDLTEQLIAEVRKKSAILYLLLKGSKIQINDSAICISVPNRLSMQRFALANRGSLLENSLESIGLIGKRVEVTVEPAPKLGVPEITVGEYNTQQPQETNFDNDSSVEVDEERIYLMSVYIENFRSIEEVSINFQKHINVIIGSNNSGKSTIIDAIRLALQVGKYRKSKYVTIDDFRNIDKEIKINLKFHCPDLVTGMPELKTFEVGEDGKRHGFLNIHVVFYVTKGGQVKQRFWGGNAGGKVPDDDVLDIFSFDYLGALRDATASLKPSTNSKIADLLLNLRTTTADRSKIEAAFNTAQNDVEVKQLISEANVSVGTHLDKIALKHDQFGVKLQPLPPIFEELVGSFEMKLLISSAQSPISQNGLGYNNVLYASTVLGHVQSTKKHESDRYHTLLIEEPEAHLHPQLEDSFFSYLSVLGNDVGSQVIATSHSAIISSATDIDNLIVLNNTSLKTEAVNLSSINLTMTEKRKISRYLDVTKSKLFFAKSVMFVEGITEALLMPNIADYHFNEKDSLLKRGIEIVNIDGVSFEPYAKLFNNPSNSLPMKASIITDKDSYVDDEGTSHDLSERAANTLLLNGNHLKVFTTSTKTFEIDLWGAGNDDAMKSAAGALFTRSKIVSAEDILRLMNNSSVWGKGDFAHELLERGQQLKTPKYIADALDWVS
jgi:putative ATP-dependent endonuclease of the OLD family